MTVWLRVRRAWALVAGLIGIAVFLVVAGEHQAMVPTVIGGGTSAILWSTFAPLGWASVTAYAIELRGVDVEARPVRRLAVFDAALVAGSTAGVIVVISALVAADETWLQIVAHVLIVTGTTVAVAVLAGAPVGILVTTILVVVTFSYGVRSPGSEYVRILQAEGDTAWSLGLGVVLFAVAMACVLSRRTRVP